LVEIQAGRKERDVNIICRPVGSQAGMGLKGAMIFYNLLPKRKPVFERKVIQMQGADG
jgi:hypothetical protein